jgi:cytochrome d ubiquinol oxidase subunit II
VALIFTPIVLLYEGWTYWIFRKRITGHVVTTGSV